jgi:hypothetical protein
MSYKIITKPDARNWYISQTGDKSPPRVTMSDNNLKGNPEAKIKEITLGLSLLKEKMADKNGLLPKKTSFEFEVGKLLHQSLIDCSYIMLTDADFWRWFTIANDELLDIALWRHDKNRDTMSIMNQTNLGIGNIKEGFYSRSWMRVFLSYDENLKNPYDLARKGDQDFWRSHILRQSYAKSKEMIRALIRFQYSDDLPRLNPSGNKKLGVRHLVRNLSVSLSTIAIDVLDDTEALEFINNTYEKMQLE